MQLSQQCYQLLLRQLVECVCRLAQPSHAHKVIVHEGVYQQAQPRMTRKKRKGIYESHSLN